MIKSCGYRIFIFNILFAGSLNLILAQSYQQFHQNAVVIDGHNDLLTELVDSSYNIGMDLTGKTQSDLSRFRQGGIDVQIFSVWCDGHKENPFSYANRQIDTLYSWINHNSDKMMLIKTPEDIKKAVKEHKLGAMIGVEGGHMIENDLNKLDSLYQRGARYMTLTWNNSNKWATSAMDETSDSALRQPKGLSSFGKQVIHRMNELGMLVDISHSGEKTFWDAINTTTKPLIASHSGVYPLSSHFRNLKNEQIRAIGKNNGIVMICFLPEYIDSVCKNEWQHFNVRFTKSDDSVWNKDPNVEHFIQYMKSKYPNKYEHVDRPTLDLMVDHIDYIVKLIGVDHVGLGSDFDGMGYLSAGLNGNGLLDYPLITDALMKRGYRKKEIEKILGGNIIRVFKANIKTKLF